MQAFKCLQPFFLFRIERLRKKKEAKRKGQWSCSMYSRKPDESATKVIANNWNLILSTKNDKNKCAVEIFTRKSLDELEKYRVETRLWGAKETFLNLFSTNDSTPSSCDLIWLLS